MFASEKMFKVLTLISSLDKDFKSEFFEQAENKAIEELISYFNENNEKYLIIKSEDGSFDWEYKP